jgi:hypothetical protein
MSRRTDRGPQHELPTPVSGINQGNHYKSGLGIYLPKHARRGGRGNTEETLISNTLIINICFDGQRAS